MAQTAMVMARQHPGATGYYLDSLYSDRLLRDKEREPAGPAEGKS